MFYQNGKSRSNEFWSANRGFDNENTQEHWEETKTFLEYLLDPENSLDVIDSGLWLPNQDNWFSDETYLQKWAVSDRSPEYKKKHWLKRKSKR